MGVAVEELAAKTGKRTGVVRKSSEALLIAPEPRRRLFPRVPINASVAQSWRACGAVAGEGREVTELLEVIASACARFHPVALHSLASERRST